LIKNEVKINEFNPRQYRSVNIANHNRSRRSRVEEIKINAGDFKETQTALENQ